jgi:sterol desaturase/sphingolipid hydroxylase (fatty acid hydroxylase superfamily)
MLSASTGRHFFEYDILRSSYSIHFLAVLPKMAHLPTTHSEIPIRLFKSDFLEFFTHIHPAVIVIIWLPVAILFMAGAIFSRGASRSAVYIPAGFLLGLLLWTLTEYTLHRFVFHYEPRSPRQERIVFLIHGIHHAQPQDKTRLVMPPIVSIPLALAYYGLVSLILGPLLRIPHWTMPIMSGLISGYLVYDLTHYATHHLPLRRGYLKFLKRYHMKHHYKTPSLRFGFTSPIWDMVFGTFPEDELGASGTR